MTTGQHVISNHDASMWLREAARQVLSTVQATGLLSQAGNTTVVAQLKPSRAGAPSDRTCDRCGHYVPQDSDLYTFALDAAPRVILTGGLCQQCAHREFRGVERMRTPPARPSPAQRADHERLTRALQTLPTPPPCKGDDRYIDDHQAVQALAAQRCTPCPILARCRAYGLAWPMEVGTYGGLTELERVNAAPTPGPDPDPSPEPRGAPPAGSARKRHPPDPRAARSALRERLASMTPAERRADRADFNRWRQSRYRAGQTATRAEYDTPDPTHTSTQPPSGAHTRKDR